MPVNGQTTRNQAKPSTPLHPPNNAGQGALEKKETNAHVHLQNPSKKHPPTSFFFSFFFFPRPIFLLNFQAFLSKWSSTTPPKKKVDVKMFYKKMRKIPFRFFLREREPLNGLILIEATYRNGIHGSH
jgi:hypothetical protein